jgi:hypothetical protein
LKFNLVKFEKPLSDSNFISYYENRIATLKYILNITEDTNLKIKQLQKKEGFLNNNLNKLNENYNAIDVLTTQIFNLIGEQYKTTPQINISGGTQAWISFSSLIVFSCCRQTCSHVIPSGEVSVG